jgi:hypothetical protein
VTEDNRAEKVRKLLAKADRAATPEEAEAFYSKAHELMTKWALDEAVLRANDPSRFEFDESAIIIKTTYKQADVQLAVQIAISCGCEHFVSTRHNGTVSFHFFGEKGDVNQALFLYTSLQVQVAAMARREVKPIWESCSDHAYRRSFRLGFAVRIGERLREARDRTIQDAVSTNPDLLPVLVSDEEKVSAEFRERHPDLVRSRRSRFSISGHGMGAGAQAADGADIGNARVGAGRKEIGR